MTCWPGVGCVSAAQPGPVRQRGPDHRVRRRVLGHRYRQGPVRARRPPRGRLVPGSGPRPPHHLHPPSGESVGGQGPAPPAGARPGRLRPQGSILDSFPVPVCRFGRAYRCRRLAELAAFGRDEGAKQTYYGLRAHLRVCWPGVIADGHLAPANLHGLAMAEDLLAGAHGWALGDRSYWSPARAGLLADQGVWLLAPSRSAGRPGPRLPRRLTQARRRIETVIGQLVERYHATRVWAATPGTCGHAGNASC